MKAAPFDYYAPASIAQACALLAEAGGGASVLAGGQSLMPLLALRMSQPFILVDITKIAALTGIAKVEGGIRIGPATRQCAALADPLLEAELPALVRALRHVGHHQTRNRGTIGGSIALGEPAAELPACAAALGAEIEITSQRGQRRVRAADFYAGPYLTVLEPDELITGIVFPSWPRGHIALFRELARRPGDFALTGLVGALALEGQKISRAGLAWFGMGPTPMKARLAEAALLGQAPQAVDAPALADLALADTAPLEDHHASAAYRLAVAKHVFVRAFGEALGKREAA